MIAEQHNKLTVVFWCLRFQISYPFEQRLTVDLYPLSHPFEPLLRPSKSFAGCVSDSSYRNAFLAEDKSA